MLSQIQYFINLFSGFFLPTQTTMHDRIDIFYKVSVDDHCFIKYVQNMFPDVNKNNLARFNVDSIQYFFIIFHCAITSNRSACNISTFYYDENNKLTDLLIYQFLQPLDAFINQYVMTFEKSTVPQVLDISSVNDSIQWSFQYNDNRMDISIDKKTLECYNSTQEHNDIYNILASYQCVRHVDIHGNDRKLILNYNYQSFDKYKAPEYNYSFIRNNEETDYILFKVFSMRPSRVYVNCLDDIVSMYNYDFELFETKKNKYKRATHVSIRMQKFWKKLLNKYEKESS